MAKKESTNSAQVSLTHPGEKLNEELKERSMTQKDLADAIDKPTTLINEIVKGIRRISPEMSILLGAALDMDPGYWISTQIQYEIEVAQEAENIKRKTEYIRIWNQLKSKVNVSYLKKHFGLSNDIIECVGKIFSYLGVKNIDEFDSRANELCLSYFRMSDKAQVSMENLLTWVMVAKHNSEVISLNEKYSKDKIDELVAKLNLVFYQNRNTTEKIERLLNEYGIKFFLMDKLEKMPVDGYSFWQGDNPTIVLTVRHKRLDNFAFTLMHELGHIYMHLDNSRTDNYIDINTKSDRSEKEIEANRFAENKLIGDAPIGLLFNRCKNPYTASSMIMEFADKYKISRSIVTGQYQYHCNSYSVCRELLDNIQ